MRGRHIALLVSLAVAVMTQAGPLVAADEQPAASEMPVSTSTPDVAAESPAPATVEAPGQGLTVLPMERIDRAEEKLAGRWRTIRRSPFAAHGAAGAWTGSELIVVDPLTGKTAGYDPDADRWSRYPTAPHVFAVEEANAWTDDELIVLAELGVIAFSPGERRWRRLPDHPIAALATSAVWTGEELIAVTGFGSMASYRPAEDHWAGRGERPGAWERLEPALDRRRRPRRLPRSDIGGRWRVGQRIRPGHRCVAAHGPHPPRCLRGTRGLDWRSTRVPHLGAGRLAGERGIRPDRAHLDALGPSLLHVSARHGLDRRPAHQRRRQASPRPRRDDVPPGPRSSLPYPRRRRPRLDR